MKPASNCSELYQQYVTSLSTVLDKHAPLIRKRLKKSPTTWLSEQFKTAKRLKRQFERMWRKNKTALNRARLRKQISLCNSILNKDKTKHFKDIVDDNKDDAKKLWSVVNGMLHRQNTTTLPDSDGDDKSLSNRFGSFFCDKISQIRDGFTDGGPVKLFPDSPPPCFDSVSSSEVKKIIMSSPTKSCLLDPWPTFLVKEYMTYYCHLSLSLSIAH